MKSNQNGGTMMETLMMLSIITVLSISGIKLIGSLMGMFRQNMVSNEIIEIQKNITARYRALGDYAEIPTTIEDWKKEKILPHQMIVEDSLVHRQGGAVSILPRPRNEGEDIYPYFQVTFNRLPQKTCLLVAQINWVNSHTSDLIEMKINNTHTFILPTRNSGIDKTADNALPAKTKVIMDACKKGDNNAITWTFQ